MAHAAQLSPLTTADAEKARAVLDVMRAAGSVGDSARVSSFEQLQGGWSRHSDRVDVDDPDAGEFPVIVRVRQPGGLLDTSLEQEYRTYEVLLDEPLPTPRLHGFRADGDNAFGGPLFVMDRLPGSSPNVWRKADRDVMTADWEGPRGLAKDLVDYLRAIHAVGADSVREFIEPLAFRDLVLHWKAIYEDVRLVRDPIVEEAYDWVLDREPDPVAACLVHGDYRIGNCLVADNRVTGILDWELAHVGDPRFDLGYIALDYNGGKFAAPGSPLLGAVAGREWFWERYSALSGGAVDLEVVKTFSVIGALMLIANLSAGVNVYATGQATDIRMLWSRFAIPGIRQDIVRLMDWPEA
jgi:aminoglycoside phosphotransferase (APT) family kinase protein